MAMFGWATKDAPDTLRAARILAHRLGEMEKLVSVLNNISAYHTMICEFSNAAEVVNEIYSLRESDPHAVALVTACAQDSMIKCWQGNFVEAQKLGDSLLDVYDFEKHKDLVHRHNHDPKCVSLSWGGLTNWALGWPDQAKQTSSEQLELARELGHAWNLIWALTGGTSAMLLREETSLVLERAAEALTIAQEHAMDFVEHSVCPFWAGQALIASGHDAKGLEQLSAGTKLWRASGGLIWVPFCQAMMAQALTRLGRPDEAAKVIEETLELIEATGHRNAEAEVHRIKGWFLQSDLIQDLSGAERSFMKAIDVARSQQAKGWELRAATSLARFWQSQGKSHEAHDLLAPVHSWFTEGFDTLDLIEAKALLDELA